VGVRELVTLSAGYTVMPTVAWDDFPALSFTVSEAVYEPAPYE
jgi:hypothetical protein